MLSYEINLSNQTLTISNMSGIIYKEQGFSTTLASIFCSIVGNRLKGFMLKDHLEVYLIKRDIECMANMLHMY